MPPDLATSSQVTLLGDPTVTRDGSDVTLHSRRTMALLAYVALEPGPHARSSLAPLLWDDVAPTTATGNLRAVLSNLRQQLPDLVTVTREAVVLRAGGDHEIDATGLLAAAATAVDDAAASADQRLAGCAEVDRLARGELLPGFERVAGRSFARWLEAQRTYLEHRTIEVATVRVDLLLEGDRALDAVEAALRLISLDEYRERSHRALVSAFWAAGERQAALRQLAACRAHLVGDLGVELGPEMMALEEEVRRGVAARRGGEEPGPPRAVDRFAPLPSRPVLYGRADLLARLDRLTDREGGRLVTLTGAGGMGKTALAVELGHAWREQGEEVVFVDLTATSSPHQVVPTIAAALGASGIAPCDQAGLAARIGDRAVRLVLDGFEHLPDAAGGISDLLAACPELFVLVTSQRPLRLREERIEPVPPLAVPSPGPEATPTGAVRLFQHRAVMAGVPRDELEGEAEAIDHLCRLLAGVPLAIELAAARRREMGAEAIADALERREPSLLAAGAADAPQRHRSLRDALDHTLALVDDADQDLFAGLAVFDGPFTLDMAHQVGAPDATGEAARATLTTLVDLQLVRTEDTGGRVWFSLLPAVRALAGERLAALGERDATLARLTDHDCALAAELAAASPSVDQQRLFADIDHHHATLTASLDRLHAERDPRELAAVTALARYWFHRGHMAEGARRLARCPIPPTVRTTPLGAEARAWAAVLGAESVGYSATEDTVVTLTEAVDAVPATAPAPTRLRLLLLAAHGYELAGRHDLSRGAVETGLPLARAAGETWTALELSYHEAMLDHLDGDDAGAARVLHRVRREAELVGHDGVTLYARMLTDLIGVGGPAGGTPGELREMRDLAMELGDRRQVVWLDVSLGTVAMLDDDPATARRCFRDALAVAQSTDYQLGLGFCLMGGAAMAALAGDTAVGLELHGALEADLDSLVRSMPRAYSDVYLGLAADLEEAAEADPTLADRRRAGAAAPRRTSLARLDAYLHAAPEDSSPGG